MTQPANTPLSRAAAPAMPSTATAWLSGALARRAIDSLSKRGKKASTAAGPGTLTGSRVNDR